MSFKLINSVIAIDGFEPPRSRFHGPLHRLSYIATLFMNRGGDQPPMAKIGLAPMKPFGGGFTVRCRCYWTTLPNYALFKVQS